MANLINPQAADKTEVFKALCWSRAERWRAGEIPAEHGGDGWIGYAVDPLQAWAFNHGLIEAIGQDAVQQIMANAFAPVRGPDEPKAWPQKGVNPGEDNA